MPAGILREARVKGWFGPASVGDDGVSGLTDKGGLLSKLPPGGNGG
jgi:hypothetical protein